MTQITPVEEAVRDFPLMNTEDLQSLDIPLKKLIAWNENVRRTNADEGIEELAASIASHGLLQSLVVRKEPRGKYAVVAGRRRLRALSLLVSTEAVPDTLEIPCRLTTNRYADLTEISLAENVVRQDMHPADQFEAFQRLIANGKTVTEVAARFGVSETIVTKRLALAKVSPKLLQKYREGELTLDVLQASTLTDDHTRQEEMWEQLQGWDRTPQAIRRLLSKDDIDADDKRVRFVGLTNYEAEGGFVRRDLFADGEKGAYICDASLLNRMVSDKLQALADHTKADGWKWVHVQPEPDHSFTARMRQVHAEPFPLSPEEETDRQSLEQEQERLEQELEGIEETDEANYQRLEEIQDRIAAIDANRRYSYSADVKTACGVVISIGRDGDPEYRCGLLRSEDERELTTVNNAGEQVESTEDRCNETTSPVTDHEKATCYSATLTEYLTQHRTAAIAAELMQQPKVALATVVHSLVLSQFGLDLHLYHSATSIQLSTTQAYLRPVEADTAYQVLEQQRNEWIAQFPRSSDGLWRWCLEQEQDTLLKLVAFCAAKSLNAVQTKGESARHRRLQHADAVATALGMEMTKWFTPTVENFFNKISKALMVAAMTEAGKPPMIDAAKLKKAEFAAIAERTVQGTGWLPELMRIRVAQHDEEVGYTLEEDGSPEDSDDE